MLPASRSTRVDQYKLQALGDTDGPMSGLGQGWTPEDPKLPWGAGGRGKGLGVGGDL